MSKVVFSKVIAVASLIGLSSFASAEAYVSYKEVPGVVADVNAVNNSITINTKDGATKTYSVKKSAKVATEDGRVVALGSLEKGDTVRLKSRATTPVSGEIKGKILSINSAEKTVKLREENTQNIVHVKFIENTSTSANETFANLHVGNNLVVPFAGK